MADVASDGVRVDANVTIPSAELSWRFSRAGGPGGQHVNTTDSRVELSWDVGSSAALGATRRSRALHNLRGRLDGTVLTVVASERRSQLRNRQLAAERLATIVAEAIAPPPPRRRATKPSRGASERRLDSKRRDASTKQLRRRPTE